MMHDGARLPLHRRPVYSSRNPDETRAFMAGKEFTLELAPREAKAFDFVANVGYMPGSYLGYIQYGAAATIHVPDIRARDDYWVHLPVQGACEVTNNIASLVCEAGRAVISSPVGHVTRSETNSSRLTFSVTRATMISHLAALLGDAPNRQLEFSPTMDLASGGGRRLMSYVQLALLDLDESDDGARSRMILSMHEQFLLTSLLLSQPHNYTSKLDRLAANVQPHNVMRAIDFIEAHLDTAITLADITRAAGVPGRTLLQHFKDYRGVSPMRYLRDARFARAREALMRPENDESVTEIALAWGFSHLGRFAVDYRNRFGETPSQTYRRGRNLAQRTRGRPI
jgi:AraC-like DNA-binding protein